jgi:hypothetical protein
VFDLAGGQPSAQIAHDASAPYTELTIPWAQSAADMAAWAPMYTQLNQEVSDGAAAAIQLDLAADQQEATTGWLTQRRDNAIFAALGQFTDTNTQLASLNTEEDNSLDAAADVRDELNSDLGADEEACSDATTEDCYTQMCAASEETRYQEWRTDIEQAYGAQGDAVELVEQEAEALAADTTSTAAQQELLLDVRVWGNPGLALITMEADALEVQLTYGTPCTISSTPAPAVGQINTPTAGASNCDSASGNSVNIDLADSLAISVDCEDVSITGHEPGPLGLFATVDYNVAHGSVTVFAGGMLGGSLGFPAVSASAQAGAYLTVGQNGFEDAGFRLELNAGSAGTGIPTYNNSTTLDVSLANAFDWTGAEGS